MASRARAPSTARAARPAAWVEEGRGQLCRVEGYSPALGSSLVVYAVLPRPAAGPSALERLAVVLSGDGGFAAHTVAAEDLPFSASGYAVVDPEGGRVPADAVREEVAARLEERRARRPTLFFYGFGEPIPIEVLLELRRLGFGLEVRFLSYETASPQGAPQRARGGPIGFAVELRAPRPLAAEERARIRELLREGERYRHLFLPRPREEEALARAGLLPLAEIAPGAYWARAGLPQPGARFEGGAAREREVCLILRWLPSDLSRWLQPLLDAEEPRGRGVCGAEGGVRVAVRSVDDRLLELAEKANEASRRLVERYFGWLDLVGALREAEREVWAERGVEPILSFGAPIAHGASARIWEPRAKVWEEGGRVKVWLHPELKWELEWTLALGEQVPLPPEERLRNYLRALSERLGREVELVGEEPPFRLSPEVDAAAEELLGALRELVGSA